MGYERRITLLKDGSAVAECGPMRIRISAWVGRLAQPQEAMRAARESMAFLEDVARDRQRLMASWASVAHSDLGSVGRRMWESVAMVGDQDLTPMASVAGTIAEEVADFLAGRGMTRVIVDNGGDIAFRLTQGEEVRVGLRPKVSQGLVSHFLLLEGSRSSWGVATSGLGGRSLTRGIAWAATVLAERASLADAAATAVANATWVDCPEAKRTKAGDLDPGSDIAHLEVTVEVGGLPEEVARLGLEKGLERASRLMEKGVILGAFVCVGSVSGSVGLAQRLQVI